MALLQPVSGLRTTDQTHLNRGGSSPFPLKFRTRRSFVGGDALSRGISNWVEAKSTISRASLVAFMMREERRKKSREEREMRASGGVHN